MSAYALFCGRTVGLVYPALGTVVFYPSTIFVLLSIHLSSLLILLYLVYSYFVTALGASSDFYYTSS